MKFMWSQAFKFSEKTYATRLYTIYYFVRYRPLYGPFYRISIINHGGEILKCHGLLVLC